MTQSYLVADLISKCPDIHVDTVRRFSRKNRTSSLVATALIFKFHDGMEICDHLRKNGYIDVSLEVLFVREHRQSITSLVYRCRDVMDSAYWTHGTRPIYGQPQQLQERGLLAASRRHLIHDCPDVIPIVDRITCATHDASQLVQYLVDIKLYGRDLLTAYTEAGATPLDDRPFLRALRHKIDTLNCPHLVGGRGSLPPSPETYHQHRNSL